MTTKCDEYNLILNPKSLIIDFKIAIQNAAKLVQTSCVIKRCKFYLIQLLYRKIYTHTHTKSYLLKCARTSKDITDFTNKLIQRYSYVKIIEFNNVKLINEIL